jgi:hypothetical protein
MKHACIPELAEVADAVLEVTRRVVDAEEAPSRATRNLAPVELPPADERTQFGRLAALALPPIAAQVLRLLVVAEIDRHVQRALRRLASDPTQDGVGVDGLITAAEGIGLAPLEVLSALAPGGALLRLGLVTWTNGDGPLLTRRATVPERVLGHVLGTLGGQPEDPPMSLEPLRPLDELCLARTDAGRCVAADKLRVLLPHAEGRPIWIVGPPGVGRRTMLAAVAAERNLRVLCIDYRHVARRKPVELMPDLWREVLLQRAVICFHDVQVVEGFTSPADFYAAVVRANLPAVMTSTEAPALAEFEEPPPLIEMAAPADDDRLTLWHSVLPGVDGIDNIASRFHLLPGPIRRIAAAAEEGAALAGRSPIASDVAAAVSQSVGERVARLGRRITDTQTWDDLVLPDDTRTSLSELVARVRCRHLVLDQWGFQRKLSKGTGVTALFAGPPGTGKTMAAGLVARELGLELYQIDLSRIVSKWVGETEKNLAQIFDAAEGANVMLLFDEADSLFGKRTEVKTSNDRHANTEVNYLLQRIERFSGVCVLTTNLEVGIDPAFLRRLSVRITFPIPDVDERAELWRRLLPAEVKLSGPVHFVRLAERFEMCGGYIRNAVLRAAFLAAGEGCGVSMALLERAIALEYRDAGRLSTAGTLS